MAPDVELDRTEEFDLADRSCGQRVVDLAGRLYGAPTWELLGGFRRDIPLMP